MTSAGSKKQQTSQPLSFASSGMEFDDENSGFSDSRNSRAVPGRGEAPSAIEKIAGNSRLGSDEMVFDEPDDGADQLPPDLLERSWQFKSIQEYDGELEYIYERIKSKADGSVRVRKYQKLEFLGKGGFA